jgi:hypothetical protein
MIGLIAAFVLLSATSALLYATFEGVRSHE